MSGITVQPDAVAVSHYVGVLAARNASLRDAANEVLRAAMRDGTLERIFRKWNVWNDDQPALYDRLLKGEPVPPVSGADVGGADASATAWDATIRYVPALLRASVITILLSCLSMGLAVALGVLIAI